jgi:glucose 1-dehydrogenase
LSNSLALEVAPLKINVNNIGPGMVLTPFNQEAIDNPKVLEEQVQLSGGPSLCGSERG